MTFLESMKKDNPSHGCGTAAMTVQSPSSTNLAKSKDFLNDYKSALLRSISKDE
jgi:hypothetical protein